MTQTPPPSPVPPTVDADKIVEGSFNPNNSVAQGVPLIEREAALERQRLADAGQPYDSGYPTVAAGVAGQTNDEGQPVFGTPPEPADEAPPPDPGDKPNLPPQTVESADGGRGVAPEAQLPAEAVEGFPRPSLEEPDEAAAARKPEDDPVEAEVGTDGRPAGGNSSSTQIASGSAAGAGAADSEGGEV